jgi:hypothetical protein
MHFVREDLIDKSSLGDKLFGMVSVKNPSKISLS